MAAAAAGTARWAISTWGGAAAALLILNLLDAVFTLAFLQLGLAREVNPLMRAAYGGSPLVFMAVKLAAVSGGVALLVSRTGSPAARWALRVGAIVYAAIVAWHLAFLVHLL